MNAACTVIWKTHNVVRGSSQTFGRADDGSVVRVAFAEDCPATTQLESIWPPLGLSRHTDPPSPPALELTVSGDVDRCRSALALFAAERLSHHVAVHAGLIVMNDMAVVLSGPSMSGKSTLCEAAGQIGLRVLSDEYALLRDDGRVEGWPRPIRLRTAEGTWKEGGTPVNDSQPYPVGLVATLTYLAGQQGLDIGRCSPGEAVMDLLANTICAQSRPNQAFNAAVTLARSCSAVRGIRGEADESAVAILELLRD